MRTSSPRPSAQTYCMMRSFVLGAMVALAHTTAGCNAGDDTQSGGAGGSAAGTGGEGGKATSTSSSPGDACGGSRGLACATDAWCRYALAGSCGAAGEEGSCLPRPAEDCPFECAEVCGCDGVRYCNACHANAAGVDVSEDDSCPPDGYSGTVLASGSELVVFKVDVARGICLRWTFAANEAPDPYGVQVSPPWSTMGIVVTSDMDDCALDDTGSLAPPKGDSVQASDAAGSVFVPTPWDPCHADVDATVVFQSEASWVPDEELFDSPVVPLRKCGPE